MLAAGLLVFVFAFFNPLAQVHAGPTVDSRGRANPARNALNEFYPPISYRDPHLTRRDTQVGRRMINGVGNVGVYAPLTHEKADGDSAVGGGADGQDAVGGRSSILAGGEHAHGGDNRMMRRVDIPHQMNGTFQIGGHTVVIFVDGQPVGASCPCSVDSNTGDGDNDTTGNTVTTTTGGEGGSAIATGGGSAFAGAGGDAFARSVATD
ncbi:hypothetical protein BC628DRAFT_1421730 [Trametes gibbosa]|nr:hypothetical protein BC628DRAFT_1421730 [Trametes gibbosa]